MTVNDLPLAIISHQLPETWLTRLKGRCRTLVGRDPAEGGGLARELDADLAQAEGLFSLLTVGVNEELLDKTPRLRVVSNMAVGVDNVDLAACTRRGIPVGHTPGVLTESTADLTMALLLAAARQLPQASRDARDGKWTSWLPTGWLGADLDGATLGIVGMGKIGSAVAKRSAAFGLKILYANPTKIPEVDATFGAIHTPLDKLLGSSDFVSLHVPMSDNTRGLMDENNLRMMKKSAILINTSRGPVVDQRALFKALDRGWIAAAALDVTDPEPLPPDNPLYALGNCLILPHIGSATRNTRRKMAELACENLLAGLEGRPLPHCANPEVSNMQRMH